MSLHTTQEWHQHTAYNLSQAQLAHKIAAKQCFDSRRAQEETMSDNLTMYGELHTTLEQKVNNSHRLVEKLQKRADSVEQSLQQTRQSLAVVDACFRAKETPMSLCTWRMEQRERRPLREQVRDAVEVALEMEKAVLVDAQKRLRDALKRTKTVMASLEGKLEEVRNDIEEKTQALGVDEMCLRTAQRSLQTVMGRSPSSPPSSRLPSAVSRRGPKREVALQEGVRNEVSRQQETIRLVQSAANQEEAAKAAREDNQKLIAHCERAADEATAKSERALQERISDNQQMRRRLEGEIKETHSKIEHTKQTMSDTRSQLKALSEPIELTATCSSWRQHRATREHITDPVSSRLQEHQLALLRSHEELREHHHSEKAILQDLQERRDRLKEDLRDKTASLHIDLNCLTHEAALVNGKPGKNLSKFRLGRAMKVDASFVPAADFSMRPSAPMTAR